MNNCQTCRQHIETLKLHAQALILSQHELLKENDVLTSLVNELSMPSQQQRLWKEKYEEMVVMNSRLEESCKKARIVLMQKQNTPSKRNYEKRGRYSVDGSIKRSGSVTKMQNFMNRVLQKPNNPYIKLKDHPTKNNKRIVLKL